MTADEPIKNREQAKKYFVFMGCSSFHMLREYPQRFEEYKALNIDPSIESEWIKEEFENKLENFHMISPNNYGHFLRSLDSIIDRKEFYLEKLVELTIKIQEHLPLDQIEYILSTIIGNNGTKSKGGLIQKCYDLKRIDLANKFYNQTKILLKKAEDNSIPLTFARGYLIDVIKYYKIEDNEYFLVNLQDNYYSDSFRHFKLWAEEGNKYSMKMLSECYSEGKGCAISRENAAFWKQKASE